MKVLITTDWYKPAINGVVTSVCNLREELQQRGHEVKILTLSRTARSYEEEGVIYMGSVNAGYIYPGARLRRNYQYMQPELPLLPQAQQSEETAYGRKK